MFLTDRQLNHVSAALRVYCENLRQGGKPFKETLLEVEVCSQLVGQEIENRRKGE